MSTKRMREKIIYSWEDIDPIIIDKMIEFKGNIRAVAKDIGINYRTLIDHLPRAIEWGVWAKKKGDKNSRDA